MPTTTLTFQNVIWTNIVHPDPQDLSELSARYPNFHPLNLKDCLTELEYPKLDHYDHYLFLVVQMPYQDHQQKSLRPAEVDIFIAHGNLITSHRGELKSLQSMFTVLQSDELRREEWMGRGASPLLYNLLNTLVDDCYPLARQLGVRLRHIEENLFNNNVQHLLHEISSLRRDIIILRSILKSQLGIVQSLIRGNWSFIQENLDPYFGDINDHLSQLCSLTDQYTEVIDGLSDTIDTLASHRIDEVVRLLTITTVLSLPVTILATIFGMNIAVPFAQHPFLFYGIVLAGVGLTIWLIWYLRTRNWL
ncbi:MAG: magnesium transporter CorA family protein [Anaerolineaceae bacterium]|nr:magnesium transporter CorA family protein [Anaerolineaceae bacterium]